MVECRVGQTQDDRKKQLIGRDMKVEIRDAVDEHYDHGDEAAHSEPFDLRIPPL